MSSQHAGNELARLRGEFLENLGTHVAGPTPRTHVVAVAQRWLPFDTALDSVPPDVAVAYTRTALRALQGVNASENVVDALVKFENDLEVITLTLIGTPHTPIPLHDDPNQVPDKPHEVPDPHGHPPRTKLQVQVIADVKRIIAALELPEKFDLSETNEADTTREVS
jgi:hypothetical protein